MKNNADYYIYIYGREKGLWSCLSECNMQPQSVIDALKKMRYKERYGESISHTLSYLKNFTESKNKNV